MRPLPVEKSDLHLSKKEAVKSEKLIARLIAYSDPDQPSSSKKVVKLIEDTRRYILEIDLDKRKKRRK